MNYQDIPAALVDIHAKLVDKLEAQPTLAPSMQIAQSGEHTILLYSDKDYYHLYYAEGDTPDKAVKQALNFIAGMVGADQRRVNAWQESLAAVIDEGHDLNLPDNVMDPLRTSSQAMTENLLTKEA